MFQHLGAQHGVKALGLRDVVEVAHEVELPRIPLTGVQALGIALAFVLRDVLRPVGQVMAMRLVGAFASPHVQQGGAGGHGRQFLQHPGMPGVGVAYAAQHQPHTALSTKSLLMRVSP
jgi:hypothetical protein